MDSNNSSHVAHPAKIGVFSKVDKRLTEAQIAVAIGLETWDESKEDRRRFRRYRRRSMQGAKKAAKRMRAMQPGFWSHGQIRYADKTYVAERPRPESPEYKAFRRELAAEKALRALFIYE